MCRVSVTCLPSPQPVYAAAVVRLLAHIPCRFRSPQYAPEPTFEQKLIQDLPLFYDGASTRRPVPHAIRPAMLAWYVLKLLPSPSVVLTFSQGFTIKDVGCIPPHPDPSGPPSITSRYFY